VTLLCDPLPRPSREDAGASGRWSIACARPRDEYADSVTRHLLTGEELAPPELGALLERALELKGTRGEASAARRDGERVLEGRSVALLFDRPSTRTRISFEVGVHELGGHPVVLREGETQLARGESARDTALVLSRLVHAVGVRTGPQAVVDELAAHATVPIVNLLTAEHHPCQALADLMTLRERFGRTDGLRVAYVGDGNNVATSLMLLGARAGVDVVVAAPEELEPAPGMVDAARRGAAGQGTASVTSDPDEAARGAHALYTDVWVSMGDEEGSARRRELLEPYRLDAALLAHARDDALVLHCLPAHPGEEITEELLHGARSAVWDQAENRLHAQKALLELLLADPAWARAAR
jgi:ornithine carbamoyltransferase